MTSALAAGGQAQRVERLLTLAGAPLDARMRRRLWVAVAAMALLFLLAAPFASRPLPVLAPFLPLYQAALIVCEAITGVLLLGQFRTQDTPALLVLAAGYLFSALMALPHLLTFPGLFSATGLLGAGEQTTAWLYFLWHAGFPLFVLAYAVMPPPLRAAGVLRRRPARRMIRLTLAGVLGLVVALTVLCTVFEAGLPVIMQGNRGGPYKWVVACMTIAVLALSLAVMAARGRKSMLDGCLILVLWAWLFEVGLSALFNHARFDFGWYAGRVFGLAAALGVLVLLLLEGSALYRYALRLRERERRLDHRRLSSSERRFQAIFEHAPMGIAHVGLDGRWLQVNPRFCAIAGHPAEVLLSSNYPDIVHPDDRAAALALRQRMLAGQGDTASADKRYLHPDGSIVWVRVQTALVRDEDGRPAYFVSVVEDMSAQRLAEYKLLVMRREMARMSQLEVAVQTAAALAHELNQPLTAVSTAATAARCMLQGGQWTAPQLEEVMQQAEQQALRAGKVLQDMVSFISQGRMAVEALDLNALVNRVVTVERSHHAGAGQPAIVLDLQPDLPPVLANGLRMERVVMNLIENGLEAMAGSPGELSLITRREDDMAWLAVVDQGPGLDPHGVERIFEPFFTTKSNGLGMGLAVSRAIVENHGGRLWAESRPQGGAVFQLCLPLDL